MRTTGLGRTFRLLRIMVSENASGYGIGLAILVLLQFCLAAFSPDATLPARLFPILLAVSGCWMAAGVYHSWSGFGRSVFYLLLPATASEKYGAAVIATTLVFVPLFSIIYWLSAFFFQSLFQQKRSKTVSGPRISRLNPSSVRRNISTSTEALKLISGVR